MLKEAVKLALMYVFGIAGAVVVGTCVGGLFVYIMKAYYDGWMWAFGTGTISIVGYFVSQMTLFFTIGIYYLIKDEVPNVS